MTRKMIGTIFISSFMMVALVSQANPIIQIIMTELVFQPDGWRLEILAPQAPPNLDGWYLKTQTDSSAFKQGISTIGVKYIVISNDSLTKPLSINQNGDVLEIGKIHPMQNLAFGISPDYGAPTPRMGQSICITQDGYYLDNTPTIGFDNDGVNATGTIRFLIKDTTGHPLPYVSVQYEITGMYPPMPMGTTTAMDGTASLSNMLARRWTLEIKGQGYISQTHRYQIYPDSTIVVSVIMQKAPDAIERMMMVPSESFRIDNPYPNPFNPAVAIKYVLPHDGAISVQVFNASGRLVEELFAGHQCAGSHAMKWDAAQYPSGVYIFRVKSSSGVFSKKCLLMK
jgi:hypothetical protein